MQCKIGKVVGNLHALQQLLPETVDSVAVVQYMPTLLLSNMKKVRFVHVPVQYVSKYMCNSVAVQTLYVLLMTCKATCTQAQSRLHAEQSDDST